MTIQMNGLTLLSAAAVIPAVAMYVWTWCRRHREALLSASVYRGKFIDLVAPLLEREDVPGRYKSFVIETAGMISDKRVARFMAKEIGGGGKSAECDGMRNCDTCEKSFLFGFPDDAKKDALYAWFYYLMALSYSDVSHGHLLRQRLLSRIESGPDETRSLIDSLKDWVSQNHLSDRGHCHA